MPGKACKLITRLENIYYDVFEPREEEESASGGDSQKKAASGGVPWMTPAPGGVPWMTPAPGGVPG